MTYNKFCQNIGYTDNGARDWSNVKVRAAYVQAFRPFFTLNELGRQIGKCHATIIHYEKIAFPKDPLYASSLKIAMEMRATPPEPVQEKKQRIVTSVLNYDYLLEQNGKLVNQVKELESKLATLKEFINGI
jgi:hypothetical protein